MVDDMGSFRVDLEIENPARPGARRELRNVLVDTGAELSSFPGEVLESLGIQRRKLIRLRQADGSVFERWTGPVFLYAVGTTATDDVIFGEPSDIVLLGSHSLEGLNLRIDPVAKQLIDGGPMLIATAA